MTTNKLEDPMGGGNQLNFFDKLDAPPTEKRVISAIPNQKEKKAPWKKRSEIPKCPRCGRQHHCTEPCGDSE